MKYTRQKSPELTVPCFKFHGSSRAGFTIIETLVAVAVLMLAITGPLTMAERSLSAGQIARKEVTAFYLAQEAIEYVRNLKDTNAISGKGGTSAWLDGLEDCKEESGCGIDPTSPDDVGPQVILCAEAFNRDCLLYQYTGLNSDGTPIFGVDEALMGLFGHRSTSGWAETHYTRRVRIDEKQPGIEARVTVTVIWGEGTNEGRNITVSSSVFNWYASP